MATMSAALFPVLLLMSAASIVLHIKCARLACRLLSARQTEGCWLARTGTTTVILLAALSIGAYIRFNQHPPIVLAFVLLPYFFAAFWVMAALFRGMLKTRIVIPMHAIAATAAALLGITVWVAVNLLTGYMIPQ